MRAKSIEELDVVSKTAAGNYRGFVEITERSIGVAAARVPEMGADAVLTVLASEI